jgi:hypothetical protein
MKKLLLSFLIVFAFSNGYCQGTNDVDYNKYTFEDPADFKSAEPDVVKLATVMLNSDITKAELDRLNAMQFLIKWMEGTPDYSFKIDKSYSLMGNDVQAQGLYMFALAKYRIENPTVTTDQAINTGVWKTIITTLESPGTNVKITSKLKKLLEANKKGELEAFLKKQK